MRTYLITLFALLALLVVPVAGAGGPWLGTAASGLGFNTKVHGQTTAVSDGSRSVSVPGRWGIPRVTLNNGVGGLSADGRVFVLAERFNNRTGELRTESAFAVLATKPLSFRQTITLQGDFGFDALSPNGSTLYLIQHVSAENLFSYRVRAYDLRAGRLLARVVADKRQAGWVMNGYPVARATSGDGRWVYTLYQQPDNYPFVHALDAVHRTAVCIGLPWAWTGSESGISTARLELGNGRLNIVGNHGRGSSFVLDTTTLRLVS